ncbi:unnamed protein product, partial [Prorocentrum cordatum]
VSRLRLQAALGSDKLRCQQCDKDAVSLYELLQALRLVCGTLSGLPSGRLAAPAPVMEAVAGALAGVAHV